MMTAEKQLLLVDNISVHLGGTLILQDISFAADTGEFIGIIGPNGAGKSTLLRSLRGLCPVSAGQIRLFGQPIRQLDDKQMARYVAYMQQEVNAGFGFTAQEVVLAGRYPYLKWWQNESEEDYRIAQKYMAFTGVTELADRPVQQVSGGERQRILLAKILTQETPLIFLDEPTASLDLAYQEEIFRHCRTICGQGKTVLLIAHDIKLAAKFCSRLILLADRSIIADGTPRTVITTENLDKAYGLNAAVFINKVTGSLDIHTYEAGEEKAQRQTIHVIGGGGAAGGILRALHEKSYRLTSGVLQQGDTDADVAAAFGADLVIGPPFCPIDKLQGSQNREKIGAADWVVLMNLYYGEQNLDNLEAAFTARRLIVLEDTPVEQRDYTGGKAACRYKELVQLPQVTVMTSAEFIEKVSQGITLQVSDE